MCAAYVSISQLLIPAVIDGAPRTLQPLMSTAAERDIAHTHANSGGETARATEAQVADGFLRIERLTLVGLCQFQFQFNLLSTNKIISYRKCRALSMTGNRITTRTHSPLTAPIARRRYE